MQNLQNNFEKQGKIMKVGIGRYKPTDAAEQHPETDPYKKAFSLFECVRKENYGAIVYSTGRKQFRSLPFTVSKNKFQMGLEIKRAKFIKL